jgi:hypothetical protein
VVVNLANPEHPEVTAEIGAPFLKDPQGLAAQFRYGFVVDKEGLKVLDLTDLASPKPVESDKIELTDAHNIYVARTYGYVSGGKQGMVILDLEKPQHPKVDQIFNAGGKIMDTRDIKVGMVASGAFAYLADGAGGMKIVQLFAPNDQPDFYGFSPKPTPKLIATFKSKGPALAISKGLDRDRAVDESGNQITVFNRRGARPFNKQEMETMYKHKDGSLYTVTNAPPGPPRR